MPVPAGPLPPPTELPQAEIPAAQPDPQESPDPYAVPSPPEESPVPSPPQGLPDPLTPPEMEGGQFPFGWKPSVPQAMWDPDIDESRRPDGLTPENEAWLAHQRALRDAGNKKGGDSVPPTVQDSPQAVVAVSDEEVEITPRNLSPDLEAAACGSSGLGFGFIRYTLFILIGESSLIQNPFSVL